MVRGDEISSVEQYVGIGKFEAPTSDIVAEKRCKKE